MAKNFEAQINVKDKNSISTLQKIIKATENLKKEMDKLSAKPIQIKAKEDPTMKKAQDDIKKLSNTKVNPIQIKVNDNIAQAMNKMDTAINNTFKDINSKIASLQPRLASLNSSLNGTGSKSGSISALGALAAGAGLGAILRGGKNTINGGSLNAVNPQADKNVKNFLNYINPKGLFSAFSAGYYSKTDTEANSSTKEWNRQIKDKGNFRFNDGESKVANNEMYQFSQRFSNSKNLKVLDEGFAALIQRQKESMRKLGVGNYLPKYQNFTGKRSNVNFGMFDVSSANKAESMFSRIVSSGKSKFASLKSSFSSIFSSIGSKVSSLVSPAFSKITNLGTRAFFGLERGAFKIGSAFGSVKNVASSAFSGIASIGSKAFGLLPASIRGPLSSAFNGVKSVAGSAISGIGGAFKSMISGASSIIKSGLGSAFNAAFTAAKIGLATLTAGITSGIHGLAEQESNEVSMKHFIKNGNAGASDEQIQGMNDSYMKRLTDLGIDTPFGDADVYAAGRRAVQVADGNTDNAYNITKMSADMAALNPGKSVEDAMEAMADLKNGETERMKEFGFKITQDDLKKLVRGSTGGAALTTDETTQAFQKLTASDGMVGKTFSGGAQELSTTLSGKWSTVTGKFKQMWVEAVKPLSPILKTAMDNVISSFKVIGPALNESFKTATSFITDLGKGDSSNFPIIQNLINSFNILKNAASPIIDKLTEQFDKISSSAQGSFGDAGNTIESVAGTIGRAIQNLTPVFDLLSPTFDIVKNAVMACWPVIQGIITVGSQIIGDAVQWLTPVFEAVASIMGSIGNIVADVWPNIEDTILTVWGNLQPVFSLFADLAQGVANVFAWAWPGIADVIKVLWDGISWILEGISKALGGIANDAQWAYDKLCQFGSWVADKWQGVKDLGQKIKDTVSNANTKSSSDGDDGKPHAFGLSRVPYNGYKAVLHEGERVLTAREVRQQDSRSSSDVGSLSIPITIHDARDPEKTVKLMVSELQKVLGNYAPA